MDGVAGPGVCRVRRLGVAAAGRGDLMKLIPFYLARGGFRIRGLGGGGVLVRVQSFLAGGSGTMANEAANNNGNDGNGAPRSSKRWAGKALWCVGLGLLANAAALVYTHAAGDAGGMGEFMMDSAAYAQMTNAPADRMLGAKGIYMMPAQLGPTSWGVYLMDVDAGTICVYRANPDTLRFRLMAVRSFRYDRYLDDFNNEGPTPKDIQKLVEQQRQRERLEGKKDDLKAAPEATTRPDPDTLIRN